MAEINKDDRSKNPFWLALGHVETPINVKGIDDPIALCKIVISKPDMRIVDSMVTAVNGRSC